MKRMRPGKDAKMLKVTHYLSFLFLKFLNCPVVGACCLFLLSMLFSGDKISVYFILFSCSAHAEQGWLVDQALLIRTSHSPTHGISSGVSMS